MKLYAIVEINDEMFDDYKEWYISADDLCIRYVEDDVYMHYKDVKDDLLELKPLPQRKCDTRAIKRRVRDLSFESGFREDILGMEIDEYAKGFNTCLDEISGENNESNS